MNPAEIPTEAASAEARAELEARWRREFAQQPKLPTSALLTGAVAMALGFGAVMFFMFAMANGFRTWLGHLAWFTGLALAVGLLNRYLANRWFTRVVIPWSQARGELKTRLEALESPLVRDTARGDG